MARSSEARAFAPDQVLEFTRTFDAPLALVWKLWRDPEHMVRWHGPEGYWLTECEIDFRVGGKWQRTMSRAADHAHRIWGKYLEIDEPRRLVFTYFNDFDEHETVVSLGFEERNGATVMHFHQAPFPSVEERDSHGWGWQSSLDLFGEYLGRVKAFDGKLVGQPRRDGVAEDIVAVRRRKEQVRRLSAPRVVEREALPYVAIARTVEMPFQSDIDIVVPAVVTWLRAHGVSNPGPLVFRYNVVRMPGLDIEMGFAPETPLEGDNRVKAGVLPAGRYATLTHWGPYDGLIDATASLLRWAREQGIHFASIAAADGEHFASRFELYPNGPIDEPDPGKWETQIYIKLRD